MAAGPVEDAVAAHKRGDHATAAERGKSRGRLAMPPDLIPMPHGSSVLEDLMMVLTKNSICDFGLKARDFTLKGVDGKT